MTVSTMDNQAQVLGFPTVLQTACPVCVAGVAEPCLPGSLRVPHGARVDEAKT